MRLLVILAALFFSSLSIAQECKEVKLLKKGEVADCTGILFPETKARESAQIKLDYEQLLKQSEIMMQKEELLKKQIEYSDKIAEKEEEKANLWRKRAVDITKEYTKIQSERGKRDWIFLLTGIGLTVLSGYAVGAAN